MEDETLLGTQDTQSRIPVMLDTGSLDPLTCYICAVCGGRGVCGGGGGEVCME